VRATQRSRFGHQRAANFCSPNPSPPPRPSPSTPAVTRAVATCWPAPRRGSTRPARAHLRGSESLRGIRMTRRALAAVSPPPNTFRTPGGPPSAELSYRHQVPPSRTHCRLSGLRPSPGLLGRADEEGRFLVPCPWIVEPWTPEPQRGRRQPAPAASAGRGRASHLTPPTTSLPGLGQRRSRPTTPPTGRSRRRSSQGPTQSPNVVDEDVRGRWPATRNSACSYQAAGQHGHAESASPGASASDPAERRERLEALHSAH
jgi:hypothetical protein